MYPEEAKNKKQEYLSHLKLPQLRLKYLNIPKYTVHKSFQTETATTQMTTIEKLHKPQAKDTAKLCLFSFFSPKALSTQDLKFLSFVKFLSLRYCGFLYTF